MSNFFEELWLRLPITAVTASISSLVSFFVYLWINHQWKQRIRNRWMHRLGNYQKVHGSREIALVLSVCEDIVPAAKVHLEKEDRSDIQLTPVHQKEGFSNDEAEWIGYLDRVKTEIRNARQAGVTRIFAFTNLPIAMATMVGAALSNGPEVVIHHYSKGSYEPVGRISVETIRL